MGGFLCGFAEKCSKLVMENETLKYEVDEQWFLQEYYNKNKLCCIFSGCLLDTVEKSLQNAIEFLLMRRNVPIPNNLYSVNSVSDLKQILDIPVIVLETRFDEQLDEWTSKTWKTSDVECSVAPLQITLRQYPKRRYEAIVPSYNQKAEQTKLVDESGTISSNCSKFYDDFISTITNAAPELQKHINKVIIPEIESFKNDLFQQEHFVILLGDTGTGKSSFIKSLLEEPLLPHKNTGACTASISTIRNVIGQKKFIASIELLDEEQFIQSMEQYIDLLQSISTINSRRKNSRDKKIAPEKDAKFILELQNLSNRANDYYSSLCSVVKNLPRAYFEGMEQQMKDIAKDVCNTYLSKVEEQQWSLIESDSCEELREKLQYSMATTIEFKRKKRDSNSPSGIKKRGGRGRKIARPTRTEVETPLKCIEKPLFPPHGLVKAVHITGEFPMLGSVVL